MIPFAGYEMPLWYASVFEEHRAVRSGAGLFDVSHMGKIMVCGPHAEAFAQHVVTGDAAALPSSGCRALYTLMCREDGGIVDDMIVYRLAEDEYLFIVNAANHAKDLNWMIQHNAAKAVIEDRSEELALMAVQGPQALSIVEEALGEDVCDLRPFRFRQSCGGRLASASFSMIARTGYTGEDGVEICCSTEMAPIVWDAVIRTGAGKDMLPVGLGARDTLRLEAGFSLYGNEITEKTHPFEAGLGRFVRLRKDAFIGRSALVDAASRDPARKLVGFVAEGRGIPRKGDAILSPEGSPLGNVTSGAPSPMLGCGIGLGYVRNESAWIEPGAALQIAVRTRMLPVRVARPPLHKS